MLRPFVSVTLSLFALFAAASPAWAQPPRPERPYRGLFASGTVDSGQSLTSNFFFASGYDDNLQADARGGNRGPGAVHGAQQGGALAQASATLSYSLNTEPLTVAASTTLGGRYYPSTAADFVRSSQSLVSAHAKLSRATSLGLNMSLIQQPDTFADLFAPGLEPPTVDAPLPELDTTPSVDYYFAYQGSVNVAHQLSRATSVDAQYGRRQTNGRGTRGEFASQHVGGSLSRQLARGLSLHSGYTYMQADYPDGDQVPNHVIDVGVDYNRSLSFSRRTTVSFGTGTAATRTHEALRYHVVGNAHLNHEIGRTWNAYATYARRVMLRESFDEPVLANTATAGLKGLFTRRLQFNLIAQAALGEVGEDRNGNKFDSYYANSSLTYSVTRFMSVGVTYSYYRHRAGEDVSLPVGYPREFDRQSVRANVNLWAPLFQRGQED